MRSRLLYVLLACVTSGCVLLPVDTPAPPRAAPGGDRIFVADGAGGGRMTTTALRRLLDENHVPVAVECFPWSHGSGRFLADQVDYRYACAAGKRLAARVCEYRAAEPAGRVYLAGHSAGSGVVLAAAESLPPNTVEDIILLAPSISSEHDLRPALRASRRGIDLYSSRRDRWYLGLGVLFIGAADGTSRRAAGRTGFSPVLQTPEDSVLYAKFRDHPWNPTVEWTGNRGGHYGAHEERYLQAYVLPVLAPDPVPVRPAAPNPPATGLVSR